MKKRFLVGIGIISVLVILFVTLRYITHSSNGKLFQGQQDRQRHYKHQGGQHRFNDAEKWVQRFENPERDEWQKPEEVIKALDFRGDEIVADIGSATGYFPVRFAKVLPRGRVFGVDIEKSMVDYLNQRAVREDLPNLVSILGEPDDPKLPQAVDMIFICNTYHHIDDRPHYFRKLKKYFRSGGRLVIVDFLKGELPVGPPDNMKMAAETVIEELSEAGYFLVKRAEILPYQYLLIFQAKE